MKDIMLLGAALHSWTEALRAWALSPLPLSADGSDVR